MRHISVLLNEIVDSLRLKPGMNIVDCTLGDGGHAEKILQATSPDGKLLGIDADPEAILRAKKYLYPFQERIIFIRDNFINLKKIVEENKFFPIQGILMDLGWSSAQFEERRRGFSFEKGDELLDMRYGGEIQNSKLKTQNLTASDLVNNLSEIELERIFRKYGKERLSGEIAEAIVEKRKERKIEKVGQLVALILEVYRKKLNSKKEIPWIGGLHPATKVFQALRIAVNDELNVLEKALPQAVEVLEQGGRLAVITFQSLEDRLVKHYFKNQAGKTLEIANKKPITASAEELEINPRARSAKLRVVGKI